LLGAGAQGWQKAEMDAVNVRSESDLESLLESQGQQSVSWAAVSAARTAIRALPFGILAAHDDHKVIDGLLPLFRFCIMSWAASNIPSYDFSHGAYLASGEMLSHQQAGNSAFVATAKSAIEAIEAAYYKRAWEKEPEFGHTVIYSATECLNYARSASSSIISKYQLPQYKSEMNGEALDAAESRVSEALFDAIGTDGRWLSKHPERPKAARRLTARKLWLTEPPKLWLNIWKESKRRLLENEYLEHYAVWIDWYERRIRGERAAFDIPGDKRRVEDKIILRRLAEATDEDFWGKGHEFVNATLKGWLDEARARVAPPPFVFEGSGTFVMGGAAIVEFTTLSTPTQDPGAIAYGINEEGKLDRLPNSDQVHLRNVPDQRRAYNDLREAAAELLAEGQRLGHRLKRALERFLQSLPERFEDAEAYLVWRDANALRRLHRAHREAAKTPDPDEAKLEPVVAEGLGGLLDLYNNFAFADDSLRAKDEARISPQERASAEVEAKAAAPLIEAVLAASHIATSAVLDDIAAETENAKLPVDDPYTGQVLDQFNRTNRNRFGGLLSGTWAAFKNANPLVQGVLVNVTYDGLKVATTTANGIDYAPLIEFIATNGPALQSYAAIAFASFPHLPDLIASIGALWSRLRHGNPQ
jgi:hypothetical protein